MKRKMIAALLCLCLMLCTFTQTATAIKTSDCINRHSITYDMIHPELRAVGTLYRLVFPSLEPVMYGIGNFILDNFGVGVNMTSGIRYEQIYTKRPDGSLLRLCVYSTTEKGENVPGLLWLHGGGYAIGIPEQDYKFIQNFVKASGCTVVAPDYTNSDDAPYPAALNDCYLALEWLRDNCAQYGVRDDQLFVGGDSAGGGLTAAISLYARDRGEISIAFQMPLYPMLDDTMTTQSSQNNDAPVWSSRSNENAWKMYLRDDYGTDNVSKYAAPARETDYSSLPPTLTYVGDIEPFTDETLIYVDNLKEAGVEVNFKLFEGCFHAFDMFSFTSVAKQANAFLIDGFMYAVNNYTKAQPSK